MSARAAIGIGCRAGCPADAIESLIREALARVAGVEARGVFTIDGKKGEGGPIEAARRLGFDLVYLPRKALRDRTPSITIPSPRAQARFGVPSVAEAAALVGAGPGSILIVERLANGPQRAA